MNPGEKSNAQAPIDLKKKRTGEMQSEVEIAVRECFRLSHASVRFNVNDVCEPLGIQQVAHHVLRSDADARVLRKADCGGFWGGLGSSALSRAAALQNRAVEAAQAPANSNSRRFVCIGTSSKSPEMNGGTSGGRTSGRRMLRGPQGPLATKIPRLRHVGYVRVPDAFAVT